MKSYQIRPLYLSRLIAENQAISFVVHQSISPVYVGQQDMMGAQQRIPSAPSQIELCNNWEFDSEAEALRFMAEKYAEELAHDWRIPAHRELHYAVESFYLRVTNVGLAQDYMELLMAMVACDAILRKDMGMIILYPEQLKAGAVFGKLLEVILDRKAPLSEIHEHNFRREDDRYVLDIPKDIEFENMTETAFAVAQHIAELSAKEFDKYALLMINELQIDRRLPISFVHMLSQGYSEQHATDALILAGMVGKTVNNVAEPEVFNLGFTETLMLKW